MGEWKDEQQRFLEYYSSTIGKWKRQSELFLEKPE
jgi:hypothetical protein